MPKDQKQINEGYIPQKIEKGYQPAKQTIQSIDEPNIQGGYIPTTSGGGNPTNVPSPPSDE